MATQTSECSYKGCKRATHATAFNELRCIFHAESGERNEEDFKRELKKHIKEGNHCFRGFIFREDVDFKEDYGVTVFKKADFSYAVFERDVHFIGIRFEEDASFMHARFRQGGNFRDARFKANVDFSRALLHQVRLAPLYLDTGVWIDFQTALLQQTDIKWKDIKDHIKQELDGDFGEASGIYTVLKNNFHTNGIYPDESWAFKKEKDAERKNLFRSGSFGKWFISMSLNVLYGYGERLRYIFLWCAGLIILSSIWLWLIDGVAQKVKWGIAPLRGYLEFLYFSVVTFTTLGYGDYHPVGGGKIVASIEALLGIFFIALFIFAFARRTSGR